MEDRLGRLLSTRPWALSASENVAVFDEAMTILAQVTGVALQALREIEAHNVPARDGATSTAVWVRNRHRVSIYTARRMALAAAAVDSAPDALRDAAGAGAVNLDQIEVITRALNDLPADVGAEIRAKAADLLVEYAAELDPAQLKVAGEHILTHVAPEVAEEAERIALERAEARAMRARSFNMTPDGAGIRVSGRLTPEGAAAVQSAISPLCAPRPSDDRTATQRRADALVEVARLALNTTDLPRNGGDRPQVVVNIPYDVLRRELGAGLLDNGNRVTPETARRLACDCRLLPIVFDGDGQPLELGRTKRLVGGALRQALVARDRGCAFPGCDRGARWTDAHHVVPWAAGGSTSLDNTVLLCGFHHGEIHRTGGWAVRIATDGFPEFIPPLRLDPQQTPRRNRYHRRE